MYTCEAKIGGELKLVDTPSYEQKVFFINILSMASNDYRYQNSWVLQGMAKVKVTPLTYCVDESGEVKGLNVYFVSGFNVPVTLSVFIARCYGMDCDVARCLSVLLSVCPSVCLSVTRRYSVETAKHIIKLFFTVG